MTDRGELVCTVRDISDQKEREQELQRTERKYQAILEAPHILAGVIDTDGKIIEINQTALDYIDADEEDIIGDPFWNTPWWSEETRSVIREKVKQAASGEYIEYEADLEQPDGIPYSIEGTIRPVTDETGDVVSLITSARDTTRRKEQKQTLQEVNQRFELLAEAVPNGLFLVAADYSELYYCNSAAENLYGVGLEELRDDPRTWMRHVHPDDIGRLEEDIEAQQNGRIDGIQRQKFRIQHPDKGTRWLKVEMYPVEEDGEIKRLAGVATDITERREREQTLARERAFIQQALDTLDDVFYVLDADGQLTRWNEQVSKLTGYSDVALDGLNALELFPEDERPNVADAIETVLDAGDATIEADLLTATGDRIAHEFTGKRLTDPEGEFFGIVGIARNLCEPKGREAELRFVRDLLDRTERIADVGGWEIETEKNEVFWTDHLFDMLGVEYEEAPPLEEALGVYLDEDQPRVASAIDQAIETTDTFDIEARFQRPDGETRWFRIQGQPVLEDGEAVSIRGAVQDITDYKKRERELKQSRREYKELLNGMNDTAWVIDFEGSILAVNESAVETLGYSREELLSMAIRDIDVALPEEDITNLREEMLEDEVQIVETIHETKQGDEIPVEVSSSLIHYQNRMAVLSIARDISGRKKREKQLEQFASIVSHDLRNPLSVAEGNLELAQEECDSDFLDNVVRAHDRMDMLIADLLTLAQEGNQINEIADVDLAALAERCWQTVETGEARIRIETDCQLRADRSRLKQLLENLIRNAIDHGGEKDTITVGDLLNGFYISDDGPGIPPEDRDQVFEMGYSTTAEGTGLGLGIAKQIAEAHGWEITVTESAEGGARFEITGLEFPK